MISAEYGFHNENDYSESDMEMKIVICIRWETAIDGNAANIWRIDKVL